ncbi:phytase [bacterium]|nr:MAG: phytase [bacterium]
MQLRRRPRHRRQRAPLHEPGPVRHAEQLRLRRHLREVEGVPRDDRDEPFPLGEDGLLDRRCAGARSRDWSARPVIGLPILLQAAPLPDPVLIAPAGFTQPVATDPDDPAVWRDARRPEFSQILGTDKAGKGKGGLYVFALDGRVLQRIGGLNRPNNVDVRGDLAVLTEREDSRLRVFRIDPKTRRWKDVSGRTAVFDGMSGEAALPMGIALYRRPDDRLFAFVSRKSGPAEGYLGVYALVENAGRYDVRFIRRFGAYSGKKEIESVAVDDARGDVYYSDETFGRRRYSAAAATRVNGEVPELELFDTAGVAGDHEGIAVAGDRFLVGTDQIKGDSIYSVYDLAPGAAPRVPRLRFHGNVDETDGIEVCALPLGPRYPRGIMVAMDSTPKRFAIFDWGQILDRAGR